MTERPILFSGAMVRAILDGTKTQTRRVVKLVGSDVIEERVAGSGEATSEVPWPFDTTWADGDDGSPWYACPYGEPGDRLWVRETFVYRSKHQRYYYRADHPKFDPYAHDGWKPSIHMPRAASRIALEVTGVRVERLQAISEADARAEGVELPFTEREEADFAICPTCGGTGLYTAFTNGGALPDTDCMKCDTAAKRYRRLWESINGPGSWAANPWAWCVAFKRVTP